jgi:hypothetical protein
MVTTTHTRPWADSIAIIETPCESLRAAAAGNLTGSASPYGEESGGCNSGRPAARKGCQW